MTDTINMDELNDSAVRGLFGVLAVRPAAGKLATAAAGDVWTALHVSSQRDLASACRRHLESSTSREDPNHLKDLVKAVQRGAPESEQEVWTLLYHAILANSLVSTGRWISAHRLADAVGLYRDLALVSRDGLLKRVFAEAAMLDPDTLTRAHALSSTR